MKFRILEILESRSLFYTASIIYRILLDFSYFKFINPLFSYSGFEIDFASNNYISSWLATLILLFFTPHLINKISDYFLLTFAFSILFPILCLLGFNSNLSYFPVLINLCIYFVIYFSLKIKFFNGNIVYPYIKNGEKVFKFVCFFMVAYLFFWYIVSGAASNFNLDLSKVYEFRDENAKLTNFGILSYLNSWVIGVFNLSLIAYALLKKKYILLSILILVQIFFYGVSAHKAVLFTPLVIYSIYFYLSRTKSMATVPIAFSSMIVVCMAFYFYNDNTILGSLFIRRVFFVPANLTFVYFDFFSNNSFAYWTNSFSFMGSAVYPEGIPSAVGMYLGIEDLRANNGFISSAFAQAGVFGVFIYAILMIFILKIIDQLSEDIGVLWFALCIVITPLRNILISSDILTVILTHGLSIAVLLLLLLRKPRFKS